MRDYEVVIGLEVHAQLRTKSKIFCSCSTQFGVGPNENTCPVCTGMPGMLPVLNARAVEYAVRMLDGEFWSTFPRHCVLNLNFPAGPFENAKGLKVCSQTSSTYRDWYDERNDPRGNSYYWLCGIIPPENVEPESDRGYLSRGYITATPLTFDLTHAGYLDTLTRHLAKNE